MGNEIYKSKISLINKYDSGTHVLSGFTSGIVTQANLTETNTSSHYRLGVFGGVIDFSFIPKDLTITNIMIPFYVEMLAPASYSGYATLIDLNIYLCKQNPESASASYYGDELFKRDSNLVDPSTSKHYMSWFKTGNDRQ